ncbi:MULTISPECIES: CinA family protein [Mumia]|uniref:CinA family protein n=1 Tax=Mumia TaxID=1546255 RepID=UPI00141E090E|nr:MULTISPECIES: CinA family protein [unclassified Mumia]QMW64981.1 CinA family protein [Mumia sp. ZJ1417]
MTAPAGADPAALIAELRRRTESLALAESLTGGALCARLVDVSGASDVVRGAVVAYAADLKATLLGVDGRLLEERGTVDPGVAEAMAQGVRDRLGATYGLATTGVAGPGPAEGKPAGTVFVAVAWPGGVRSLGLALDGDRGAVRSASVDGALALLATVLGEGRNAR